ncbi:MAG TPA: LysR family transcriptional regulator [Xanthobacteraceae bacterium]|jgi:DNA-binding transcriptional LysR family regulator|nr:LysR family transcriptional regulator [Xanthobacteraceae bacterium]
MVEISPAAIKFLRQRVSLRHLRLILVLDEERSITRTAERLCISQAAVSKTRTEIEKGIGAPLFEWFGHKLEVTDVGQRVLQSARRVVAELECLSDEFQLMETGMGGVLSIGTRTISGQPFLSRVTAAFKKAHPEVTVQLIDTDLVTLLERLSKGSISLLFGRFDATCAGAGIEAQAILSDRGVLLASPNHPLAGQRRISWPDLAQQAWILTPEGYAGRYSREHLAAELSRHQLSFPNNLVETQSLLLTMTLFQSGDFLTILPEGVSAQVESRGLARVLDVPPLGPVDSVCLMWRANIALPPAARRFRDLAVELLKTDQAVIPPDIDELPRHVDERRFETVQGGRTNRPQRRSLGKKGMVRSKVAAR